MQRDTLPFCESIAWWYLDKRKEDSNDIVAPTLKVDQKRAEERRDGAQDKTVCPQVGVLVERHFGQLSLRSFSVHLVLCRGFNAVSKGLSEFLVALYLTFHYMYFDEAPCRQLWRRRTSQWQMPRRSRGARRWSAPRFWSSSKSFSFSAEPQVPQVPASEIWKLFWLQIGIKSCKFDVWD